MKWKAQDSVYKAEYNLPFLRQPSSTASKRSFTMVCYPSQIHDNNVVICFKDVGSAINACNDNSGITLTLH